MTKRRDTMNHQNPLGYWSYEGAYSVELTDDADKSIAPTSVTFDGQTASIMFGRIKQTMGGIQLYSGDSPFHWGYRFVKAIRDGNHRLIWVNDKYR